MSMFSVSNLNGTSLSKASPFPEILSSVFIVLVKEGMDDLEYLVRLRGEIQNQCEQYSHLYAREYCHCVCLWFEENNRLNCRLLDLNRNCVVLFWGHPRRRGRRKNGETLCFCTLRGGSFLNCRLLRNSSRLRGCHSSDLDSRFRKDEGEGSIHCLWRFNRIGKSTVRRITLVSNCLLSFSIQIIRIERGGRTIAMYLFKEIRTFTIKWTSFHDTKRPYGDFFLILFSWSA